MSKIILFMILIFQFFCFYNYSFAVEENNDTNYVDTIDNHTRILDYIKYKHIQTINSDKLIINEYNRSQQNVLFLATNCMLNNIQDTTIKINFKTYKFDLYKFEYGSIDYNNGISTTSTSNFQELFIIFSDSVVIDFKFNKNSLNRIIKILNVQSCDVVPLLSEIIAKLQGKIVSTIPDKSINYQWYSTHIEKIYLKNGKVEKIIE
jgi:hypothetical protein